jgi:hypothetical protein
MSGAILYIISIVVHVTAAASWYAAGKDSLVRGGIWQIVLVMLRHRTQTIITRTLVDRLRATISALRTV